MVRRILGGLLVAAVAACGTAPNDITVDVGGDTSVDEGIGRDSAVDIDDDVPVDVGEDVDVPDVDIDVPDEDATIDTPTPDCVDGEERAFRCPDGELVPWCSCIAGAFVCGADPAASCREVSCDDGTVVTCEGVAPTCDTWEQLAVVEGCWDCVNPATCVPWGEPTCDADVDCAADSFCDPCGSTACPECDECVATCAAHNCPTESAPTCLRARPDCEVGDFAIVEDGCWTCVVDTTCQTPAPDQSCAEASGTCAEPLAFCADGFGAVPATGCAEQALCCTALPEDSCDDGAPQTCDRTPPRCAPDWELALQDGCWVCVNPATCLPWGMPTCIDDSDCGAEEYCDPCGTATCSGCIDCVSACMPHGCFTEVFASCECDRPSCPAGTVSVIRSGCWDCVTTETCTSLDIDVCR